MIPYHYHKILILYFERLFRFAGLLAKLRL